MSISLTREASLSQTDTGFNARLAYLRWLRARGRTTPETDRELAASTGVGYPLLTKWKSRRDAPDSYETREKFRKGLALTSSWLFDGLGQPPEPFLWSYWIGAVGTPATRAKVPQLPITRVSEPPPAKERVAKSRRLKRR